MEVETENITQINLDARPAISKFSITTQTIGPYVRVLEQGGHKDMATVMADLKRNESVAKKLQEAISDIFFFTSHPIDKILDKHFPDSPASVKVMGEKRRTYMNRYITVHEDLK